MNRPVLKTVTREQGNNAALIHGEVTPDGFDLMFEEVPVLVQGFRRMVRTLEFDVCEMALTTYLCAREHGVRFTALPIFLVRGFHHGAILCHKEHPLDDPGHLEGRRVGVNRGYTVTTGVWARSILQEEYGVDLSRVTWVCSGDEHVEAYRPPQNVTALNGDRTLEDQLVAGNLAAAINIKAGAPDIVPVIANPLEAGLNAFQRRGHYPINHLVVVRDAVLEEHPGLAVALFEAFTASKKVYLGKLRNRSLDDPGPVDRLHARIMALGKDPLPYGIEPNRRTLEELVAHARTQHILRKPVPIETLFAPATLGLNA